MPRDHFYYSPDGELVLQAWIQTLGPDVDDEALTLEDRTHTLTPEHWAAFDREREKDRGTSP